MQYLVSWSIDIDADNPEEAATQALLVQRDNDPDNTATVFSVTDPEGNETSVDLGSVHVEAIFHA